MAPMTNPDTITFLYINSSC